MYVRVYGYGCGRALGDCDGTVDATAQAYMMRRMKPLAAMLQSHVGVLLIRM